MDTSKLDVRTLKVGQKLYARIGPRYVYEATVEEMDSEFLEWAQSWGVRVRIGLANWDGSNNGLTKGSFIAFDAAGKEIGSYGLSADGWDTRPADADLILVEPETE